MKQTLEAPAWGSDAIAAMLRELDFKYAALVPGASYRGLHDSIVNYLGNENPEMLLCLHEEHAVAIAHGYAKVTGKPMLAIVHSNVGLMHATMAFFNAWCDRMPVVVLGATGPVDATKRRPWIDWIHTAADQGALVRNYTKWDDQPGSPEAALESLLRATQIASTPPHGPVYVCLDVGIQEQRLEKPVAIPGTDRFRAPAPAVPDPGDVRRVAELLQNAKHPVIIVGRAGRNVEAWNERVALAEALEARVVTTIKVGAVFPTDHPLHCGHPSNRLNKEAITALREADVVLNLDTMDLAGVLKQALGKDPVAATIVSCSLDRYVHNGWSMDYQALPPVDLNLVVGPDLLVSALVRAVGAGQRRRRNGHNLRLTSGVVVAPPPRGERLANGAVGLGDDVIGIEAFTKGLTGAFAGLDVCYTSLPRGGTDFVFRHPLDYLGGDGGGGVGGGPGIAVGAALALRGSGRLPVAVLGDGDFLMGCTAIWTAVANEIPLLVIVGNNRSYFNDEVHQERMARTRGRDVTRKWIGQRIDGPPPDCAAIARGQGAIAIGPITKPDEMGPAFAKAIEAVKGGAVCVVDVVILPEYAAGVAAGMVASFERGGPERGE
jgi:thiamine pyrophosphate-dependent acetolactate synthase large subunit-like protein